MIKKHCLICNKEFLSYPSQKRTTCSKDCGYKLVAKILSIQRKGKYSKGHKFPKGHKRYRTEESYINGGIKIAQNTNSKKTQFKKGFTPWITGKKHSLESKLKMSKAISGENHPCWKGGISTLNENSRKRKEYRIWRNKVLKKYKYTCQKSGDKKRLRVHHIQNFSDYPELRYKFSNGIVLCERCHIEFHKIYGLKNNTKEQMCEYLLNK